MASPSQYAACDELRMKLENVELDVSYWLKVFKEQLGVQSGKAFKYVGRESYQLLVQYVKTSWEKKALRELLNMEIKLTFHQYLQKQMEMFVTRQRDLSNTLNTLKTHSKAFRERQNGTALTLENSFREMLLIPETSWIDKDIPLINAITKMEAMVANIEVAVVEGNNVTSHVVRISGALRGVRVRALPKKNASAQYDLLKVPQDICLDFPLLAPSIEERYFNSEREENKFMEQFITLNSTQRSSSTSELMHVKILRRPSIRGEKVAYFSTMRYCFMPIASCHFDDHHLQLSDDALSVLNNIEQSIIHHLPIEDECEIFFNRYGSHIYRGPLHYGGIFLLKCCSKGYTEAEKQSIQELQVKVIDSLMTMRSDILSTEFCVSNIKADFSNYPEHLVNSTFVHVMITGTPPEVIGLPDWKNCLFANNRKWELIDCGIIQVPVWDIIRMNHPRYDRRLADILEETWKKFNLKKVYKPVQSEGVQSMVEQISSWGVVSNLMEFEGKIKILLKIKREVEESLLDPEVWATKYISQVCFRSFICSNIKSCINRNEDIAKVQTLLQDLIEPVDLRITHIFSEEESIFQRIYGTDKFPPPIGCKDFLRIERHLTLALKVMSTIPSMHVQVVTESPTYSRGAFIGKTRVEKVVHRYRQHFLKTGQVFEDCLIVTILRPFDFNPEKNKFQGVLTRSDIFYLSDIICDITKAFFSYLTHKPRINCQAYLLYLTISVSNMMAAREECIIANIHYLQRKIELYPELRTRTENLSLKQTDWKKLQSDMETLCKKEDNTSALPTEIVEEALPSAVPLKRPKMKFQSRKELIESLFTRLGLHEHFPQKLTLHMARELREDTLKALHPEMSSDAKRISKEKLSDFDKPTSEQAIYPFILLQQIMAFDSRWTTWVKADSTCSNSDSDSKDSDTDSEDSDSDSQHLNLKGTVGDQGIHPIDCLLALLHCSDNFLRQDILRRLANCQIAVPLILPHPITGAPTLLLWALRSIVKEFKLLDGSPYCGQIIASPIPFVSFLRIGHHFKSKSEILCNVINSSDNKHDIFLHYNSRGGTRRRLLAEGLVDMSWYLPSKTSDDLFPTPVAFVNLHGDASSSDFKTQIGFLCKVCTLHVVFLEDTMLEEDATRQCTIKLLNTLALAKRGVIIVQKKSKEKLIMHFDEEHLKKQFTIIRMNKRKGLADIGDKIRGKICRKLDAGSISFIDKIQKCEIGIYIDEDDADCTEGRKLAEELFSAIDEHKKEHPTQSPKKLLSLQSDALWHKWADADKEQYRMKRKRHTMKVEEYGHLKRIEMDEIRKKQYKRVKELFALKEKTKAMYGETMIVSFLTTLVTAEGNVLWYYMYWLKSLLDDLSRKLLPELHTKYLEKRNQLSYVQSDKEEKRYQDELKYINTELINASFGLEHLLREVSQIYEAVMSQDDDHDIGSLKEAITLLPKRAAQLLYDGFPIELLDGDASHMPKKWISDVLNELSNICKYKINTSTEPNMYVLSVLGLQSSGKSTMLNTLYGVQFAVSAGRCTRGAFMQLIPVHQSLQERCGVHFFLLIDTEGLRAPEFDALEAQKHDNELATFVIGMASLTLINIPGEVSGEMDNILETAVYAFLRMRKVELKPSCHFVHHHVVTGADEKLSIGRFKIKDHLDTMTQTVAKDIGFSNENIHFTDVINVDYGKDVSFFPDLWNGKLPMARVNTAYSDESEKLKGLVICKCADAKKRKDYSIINLKMHLDQLWNAILQEDFVFSFKNMDEISAFKCLEEHYGEWSWDFKEKITEWEKTAENQLLGCTVEELDSVYQKLTQSLTRHMTETYVKIETQMIAFFDESTEIMLKWKQNTEIRMQRLCEQLKQHAENHYRQLYNGRNGRFSIEKKKEMLIVRIRDQVKQLVETLEKDTMQEEDVMQIFEESWNNWIPELTKTLEKMKSPDIPSVVENCLIEFFQTQLMFLYEQLKGKLLTQHVVTLKLTIVETHLKVNTHGLLEKIWNTRSFKRWVPLAQRLTNTTLTNVEEYLRSKSQAEEDFNDQFVTAMLNLIKKETARIQPEDFVFTDEYHVHMSLTACRYAIPVFEEMAAAFRRKHDPILWIKHEMKPHFKKIFVNMYYEVNQDKAAAVTLCQQLEQPIKNAVIGKLSSLICREMRGTYSWFTNKSTLIARVLLEIGKKLEEAPLIGFSECTNFLTDPESSLEAWVKHFTQSHCDSGDPSFLSNLAERELNNTIEFVSDNIHLQQWTFQLNDWLKQFHTLVQGRLNIPLTTLCLFGDDQEISDANFFKKEIVKGLEDIHIRLKVFFSEITYSQVNQDTHKTLYTEVAGCTSQCPFCKAPCELTAKNHPTNDTIKHTTHHRPRCLGGHCWTTDKSMVLDTCTFGVASDTSFQNDDTNWKWFPYRRYTELYPEWSIPADKSLEASLFWKWFIGHYSKQTADVFGFEETTIPEEWKTLEWKKVADWLKQEYYL